MPSLSPSLRLQAVEVPISQDRARRVTETWSTDPDTARDKLQRELGRAGAIVSAIAWPLADLDDLNVTEIPHAS